MLKLDRLNRSNGYYKGGQVVLNSKPSITKIIRSYFEAKTGSGKVLKRFIEAKPKYYRINNNRGRITYRKVQTKLHNIIPKG